MSCPSPVSDAGSFRKGVNRRKNPAPFRAPLDIGHCNVEDEPGTAPVKSAASSAAPTAAPAAASAGTATTGASAVESPVTPPATPAVSASPCPLPPPAEDLLAARATRVRKVIHRTKRTRTELQGPCSNCGTTTSPQWRKGPKNKPILCNACGIRFHRNKTLDIPPPRTPGVKRKAVITMGHPLAAYYPPSRSEWGGAASSSAGLSRLTSWGQGPLAGGLKRVRGAPAGGHGSSGEDEVTAPRSPRRRTLSSKALEALNLSGMPLTRPHDPHALGGMRHVHSHIDLLACAADMLEEMDPDTESEGGGEAYWQDPADLLPAGGAGEEGAGQEAADTPSGTTTTSSGGAAAAAVSAMTIKEEGTSAAPPGMAQLIGVARAASLLAALPPRPPAAGSLMKRVASTPSLFVGRPATPLLPAAPPLCATPPPPSPATSAGGDGGSSGGGGVDMDTPDYMAAVMALKQRTGSIDAALDMLLRGGSDMVKQQHHEEAGDCHQKRVALLQAAAAQQQQEAAAAAAAAARTVVVPRSRTRGPSSRMHRVASAPSAGGLAAMDVEQPVTAAEVGATPAAAIAAGLVAASRCGGLGSHYPPSSSLQQQQQQDKEVIREAPVSPPQAPFLPYPRAQQQQQWDASTLSADAAVEVAAAAVQHLMV